MIISKLEQAMATIMVEAVLKKGDNIEVLKNDKCKEDIIDGLIESCIARYPGHEIGYKELREIIENILFSNQNDNENKKDLLKNHLIKVKLPTGYKKIIDNGIEKVINDKGEIGVIVNDRHSTGWNSYSNISPALTFEPVVIAAILNNDYSHIHCYLMAFYEYGDLLPNPSECKVEWVKQGEKFYIHEYDGMEWVVREKDFLTA